MNILVTGGAGYIGSHTCVALLKEGHTVIVADNLYNSNIEVLDKIKHITNKEVVFYNIDVTKEEHLETIFLNHSIHGVIHFAGYKAVGESVQKPLEYYYNNLVSTMVLSNACKKYKVKRFIFSSSATVYGENIIPFKEEMELLSTTNPYGATKSMCERILTDIANATDDFSVTLLRYFNPIGAHPSGLLGEAPNGIPNNLMPYITKVAIGVLEELKIYGADYNTYDGTGVRDYIHVVDLAKGHLKSLDKLNENPGLVTYNLGTGKGYSVLDLVKAFEKASGKKIPYRFVKRREGDIATCYANPKKAKEELGWIAEKNIDEMCEDSWRWQIKNPNGYEF